MARTVSLYMEKNPISVLESKPLRKLMNQMDATNLSHLLVVNKSGELSGIISKADILKKLRKIVKETPGKSYTEIIINHTIAKDVMSKDMICISPLDTVDYAIELLLQNEFHCLPVVENTIPVGIVTFYDLLKGYYQEYG